jgi:hypothetical protein
LSRTFIGYTRDDQTVFSAIQTVLINDSLINGDMEGGTVLPKTLPIPAVVVMGQILLLRSMCIMLASQPNQLYQA